MAATGGRGGPRRGGAAGLPKARGKGAGKDGRSAPSGSGGYGRKRLAGKGPTPRAEERTGHPAARRAGVGTPTRSITAVRSPTRGSDTEHVAGRNSALEALQARIPAIALLVAPTGDRDPRIVEATKLAVAQGVPLIESTKTELDRLTGRALHQGVVLRVPAYQYMHPTDLIARAADDAEPALLLALDGVTDPRNLGASVRSAAAFGGHGVLIPERRAAGMTAAAWKASAGAAARLPVAQATNLTRALRECSDAGMLVVGLATSGSVSLDDLEAATDPLVLVVGSEGHGMSRLVSESCDLRVHIPLSRQVESLNAGVAAGVALAEVARRRRVAGRL